MRTRVDAFVPDAACRTSSAVIFAACLFATSSAAADTVCRGWLAARDERVVADITKDRAADIVGFGGTGVSTARSKRDGSFSTPAFAIADLGADHGWDAAKHVRTLADLSGDGAADIIAFGDAGVWTALSNGDGTFTAPAFVIADFGVQSGWTPTKHVRVLADVSGDGRADIVAFGRDGVWTALSKGDGTFTAPAFVIADFGTESGWTPEKHVRVLADINGDRRADIVAFGRDGVWTALSNGNGTFAAPAFVIADLGTQSGWTPEKHVRVLADINGDSRADIVAFGNAGVWTALSKGDGAFTAPAFVIADLGAESGWTPAKHVRELTDVNNDGRADIVAFGNAGVWTGLSKGDGTFAPPAFVLADFGADQGWTPSKHVRTVKDITGDGKADVVAFGDAGTWTAISRGDGGFLPHAFVSDAFGCVGAFDFNLEWDVLAPSGFPLNPKWRWQRDHDGVPSASICHFFSKTVFVEVPFGNRVPIKIPDFADCTNQTDMAHVDTPDGWNGFICGFESSDGFHGHLNWFPTTYEGILRWGDHNYDDDYYMSLTTEGAPAVINPPRRQLHTEFDSDETIDDFATPWWTSFRDAVDDSKEAARKLLTLSDGSPSNAIMTGLFGVDCEHDGCKSEIHPVYALAAHVKDDPANEVWAIFVRNWGNEGYCSRKNWPADFTSHTFRIPWREGMTSVEVLWGIGQSVFEGTDGTAGPEVVYAPGVGIDVTFTLPQASQRPLIDGELHLRWTGQAARPRFVAPVSFAEERDDGPLAKAMARVSPVQKKEMRKRRAPSLALRPLRSGDAARRVAELARPTAQIGTGPATDATRKLERDQQRFRDLCKASGGAVPGLPADACRKIDEPGSPNCDRERESVAARKAEVQSLRDELTGLQAELRQETSPAVRKNLLRLIADVNRVKIPAANRSLANAQAALSACASSPPR